LKPFFSENGEPFNGGPEKASCEAASLPAMFFGASPPRMLLRASLPGKHLPAALPDEVGLTS